MKRAITLLFVTTFSFGAFSQGGTSYIDFGPKFMIGENILHNSTASFNSDRYLHNPKSLGFAGGFKLAFDFNTSFALVGEIVFNKFNQHWDRTEFKGETNETTFSKTISYTSMDIPLMFRFNFPTMRYVEAGIQFSSIKNFSETISSDNPFVADSVSYNPNAHYVPKYKSLVLGFGGYLWGSENFGISAGLRFIYGLDDIASTQEAAQPNHPIYARDNEFTTETRPIAILFVLEFNYDMQFAFTRTSCGKRRAIIGNNPGRGRR